VLKGISLLRKNRKRGCLSGLSVDFVDRAGSIQIVDSSANISVLKDGFNGKEKRRIIGGSGGINIPTMVDGDAKNVSDRINARRGDDTYPD
jgi:hypothetical protein